MNQQFAWTDEQTYKFIISRGQINGEDDIVDELYEHVLNEIGLAGIVCAQDARFYWNSLVEKYKEVSNLPLESNKVAELWSFYSAMHNVLNNANMNCTLKETENNNTVELSQDELEEEAARLEEAFRNTSNEVIIGAMTNEDLDDVGHLLSDDLKDDEIAVYDDGSQCFDIQSDGEVTDNIWTDDRILSVISLRCSKEADYNAYGAKNVFSQIVEEMGISDCVSAADARKKWVQLVKIYQKVKNENVNENSGVENTSTVILWPFYSAMHSAMEHIKETSPDGGIKIRKSPEFIWSVDITKKFIKFRGEMHSEISQKGHNAVYNDILNKLKISGSVSVTNARKKWNYLLKRFQDEEMHIGSNSWAFMKDMSHVMKHFRGSNITKFKSRASPEFLWPNELTKKFITTRAMHHKDFTEKGIQSTYTTIMVKLGLDHILNPNQLRKKWNYLVAKFKELSCATSPDGISAAHAWPFYSDMEKALQDIPENINDLKRQINRISSESLWTKPIITRFIQLRGTKQVDPCSRVCHIFSEILTELGLDKHVTPNQARKKWNYLWSKYCELSSPDIDQFSRDSWPFYAIMQKAVGDMPISQIYCEKDENEGNESEEEGLRVLQKRGKSYTCFICGKVGKFLNDFFMFENGQNLLHTQKPVMDIINHLLGKKLTNLDSSTCLCSSCTNIVNEADSVMYRHDHLKEEARKLYSNGHSEDSNCQKTSLVCLENSQDRVIENTGKEITYSKRGRKRKTTVLSSFVNSEVKSEPLDDGFAELLECSLDFDDDSEEERKCRRTRARTRARRGRRGRSAKRSTLIGRGLGSQYSSSNKRRTGTPLTGPKIYYCVECEADFKKYTDLLNHKKEVHTVVDNTPLEVEETILENGVITYFNKGKANNSDTSHPCKDCNKQFLRKDDLWYHQEIAHTNGKGRAKTAFKDRTYACEECGEVFLFKYKLKMHINSKHLNDAGENANDFTCGECGCKLGSLPGLTFHMRKHHNKSLTYRKTTEYLCSDCGFMAQSQKKLREHQEAHCGASSKPKVECDICGKSILKVSLKMHKVKMHSEFKEQCDRCGERYATKTDLLRHINVVHLRIFLYSCPLCPERFATSDSLRYHRVKAHEKPSFYCQTCGKCYKRVGELNTHIKRAHNDRRKAEICQYCGKEYYDRSGLRNHLVNKHNVPQDMTYSENYLRKKRVNGLPLAKHLETRFSKAIPSTVPQNETVVMQQQPQQHIVQHQHQMQPTHHHLIPAQIDIHSHHMRPTVVDEAAEAARSLGAYQEISGTGEEDNSLVVTEITENSTQVEQTVLVDSLNLPNDMMHHQQVHMAHAHIHPQMHHQMHHMSRLGVLYQMNMHHPGPSHINM